MANRLPSSICLLSTSSLEDFPFNSRTQFTNVLPAPIKREITDKPIFVRLRAIAISCIYDDDMKDDPYSCYLRVNLHELEQQRIDRHFDHCAGGFEYPPKTKLAEDSEYAYHTFSRTPYLKLKYSELTTLEISLVNAIGEPVDGIYTGPPTIVLFDISDAMDVDNFTISCSSLQPELYSGNKLTSFTSPLHSQMDLAKYQVALVNIVYPPSLTESKLASFSLGDRTFRYKMESFNHTEEFIERVKQDVKESVYGKIITFKEIEHGKLKGQMCFHRERSPRLNRGFAKQIEMSFSRNFTIACGQVNEFRSKSLLKAGFIIAFRGVANINLVKPNPVAMLHCDIVRNGMVGNTFSNLLACVPVMTDQSAGRKRMHQASQLIYYDVVSKPVTCINFQFTNPDGSGREFVSGEAEKYNNIIITLSFRLKRDMWFQKQIRKFMSEQEQGE